MATATFGSNVTNVALEDFGKAGVVGADMFMQESPSVYTFRFWVGFTNGITLSIPRFAGNIFPPNERSSLSWTYAPKATWNMSDGIDWGGTTSLRVVTATATFPTAVSLVDDDGFDFLVSGCTKGAWTRHNARVYDIQLFLGFAVSSCWEGSCAESWSYLSSFPFLCPSGECLHLHSMVCGSHFSAGSQD